MSHPAITGLYYITHIENLASILQHGILSHEQMISKEIHCETIYDAQIVQHRQNRQTPTGKSLWYYANLYFNPRNPMLYRLVVGEKKLDKLIVLKLRKQVLELPNILLTDGNAAHSISQFYEKKSDLLKIIQKEIDLDYWKEIDGSKRKIMAECLVPECVSPDYLECIYIAKHNGLFQHVQEILQTAGYTLSINVIIEPRMFFQPEQRTRLTDQLSLVTGDLFFSRMQTLTVSVNTMGIMGKGLASRAKYQFPDVYVRYQDLCKQKKLRTNLPAIIKTEISLISELSEGYTGNNPANWFLLFATKQHWRENSKIEYLIDGLQWLSEHYQKEGITSLALPALGCGLGHLSWAEVGPLMCKVLKKFDIPVCIYLPAEKKLATEYLSPAYLLGND